ncbi:sce7725 family protein [[Clostridium] innocuum]|uniref:sce7725 family protein n=1 Tax=Clostridium innocuum TaxID=1522 RepID=UPI001F567781|nr:sce7725 family protein [[Clostridium] innocuum]MCI2990064.1 sce7725 family protein [[Clostridium] innocuum]
MYFPYLRGRQFELIAIREMIEKNLINDKVIPIIEPVKASSTFLKTIEVSKEHDKALAIIVNPKVGNFIKEISHLKNEKIKEKYYDLLDFSDRIIHTRIIDMKFQETIEFINANYNSKMAICLNNDDIAIFEKYFKGNDFLYNIIPDKTEFRRRIRENRVMIEDHFIKSERNVDYLDKDDFFSRDHLYYKEDGYLGFSDYSIIGNEYSETGFAPYAVAIHIIYFDEEKSLRVRHFVSDSNDDISDIAGKFKEAMYKLVKWNKTAKLDTYGIRKLEEFYSLESYPGLGTVKKLSIMHHLELMNSFLDGVEI